MNCLLYSGLLTKYNQISQNVDTTAHCPITQPPGSEGRAEIKKKPWAVFFTPKGVAKSQGEGLNF